jgi:hypothetical protein
MCIRDRVNIHISKLEDKIFKMEQLNETNLTKINELNMSLKLLNDSHINLYEKLNNLTNSLNNLTNNISQSDIVIGGCIDHNENPDPKTRNIHYHDPVYSLNWDDFEIIKQYYGGGNSILQLYNHIKATTKNLLIELGPQSFYPITKDFGSISRLCCLEKLVIKTDASNFFLHSSYQNFITNKLNDASNNISSQTLKCLYLEIRCLLTEFGFLNNLPNLETLYLISLNNTQALSLIEHLENHPNIKHLVIGSINLISIGIENLNTLKKCCLKKNIKLEIKTQN